MALRKRIKGVSLRKAGASLGVSGAYIHDVLKRRRGISANIGAQLGFELVPPQRQWVVTRTRVQKASSK